MKYKIALARFPGAGWERQECTDFLVRTTRAMDKDERIAKVIPLRYKDTPITMLRNRAVLDARKQCADYLLCVDADMAPDLYWPSAPMFWPTAWDFMMARRDEERAFAKAQLRPYEDGETITFGGLGRRAKALAEFPPATISAPYCGPPPDELVYVFHWLNQESDNPNPDWKLTLLPRAWAAIMQGIQEVAAMATGLILYDMRVFDILPAPWYRYEYRDASESDKVTTEDVFQTRNASLLKLPQYVAWDCWAAHVKDKVVGKPRIVTRDMVHDSLKEAVLRGVDSNQRLVVLTDKATVQESTPPPNEPRGHSVFHRMTPDSQLPGVYVPNDAQTMEAMMAADWQPPADGEFWPEDKKP